MSGKTPTESGPGRLGAALTQGIGQDAPAAFILGEASPLLGEWENPESARPTRWARRASLLEIAAVLFKQKPDEFGPRRFGVKLGPFGIDPCQKIRRESQVDRG